MKEQIDIEIREGGGFARVKADVRFRCENWAVTEPLQGDGYGVTHVPTGRSLLYTRTLRAAKWACTEAGRTMPKVLDTVPFGGDIYERLSRDELKACSEAKTAIAIGARKLDEPQRKKGRR